LNKSSNANTTVTLQEYERLARQALDAWALPRDSELTLIKHRENAVYQLVGNDGELYALRVHRRGYHDAANLRSELLWMTALNGRGIYTPQVIATVSGDLFTSVGDSYEHYVDMLSWEDGLPLGSLEEGVAGGPAALAKIYFEVGRLAGKLHRETENWQKPNGFVRQAWDIEGLLGDQPLWGKFWELACLDSRQRSVLLDTRRRLVEVLGKFGTSPDKYGLIHCDFLPENILQSKTELCLIDFDDSGFGWYLFEIATSLFVHLGEDHFETTLEALVAGYRQERTLLDEDLAMLPDFFLLRGLAYLGWVHTRRETDTAKELTPIVTPAVVQMAEEFLTRTNNPSC